MTLHTTVKRGADSLQAKIKAAMSDGYTQPIYITGGIDDLQMLVSPNVELDGVFKAFNIDDGSYYTISGWRVNTRYL